jgi:hypothetical protein
MYKILGAMALAGLIMSGCSATPPKIMEKKVITNPTTAQGYPVDRCYTWAEQCDKPVADKICRDNGYQYSIKSTWEHKNPTQLLSGKMCKADYCGAITYIECMREKR